MTDQKPDGYIAIYNGHIQNGLFATELEELEIIVHELIHENTIDDVVYERNGWRLRPCKIVFLDEPSPARVYKEPKP